MDPAHTTRRDPRRLSCSSSVAYKFFDLVPITAAYLRVEEQNTGSLRLLTLCFLYQMLAGANAFVCYILLYSAKAAFAAQLDPDIKLTVNTTSIRDGDVIKVLLHSLLLIASQKAPARGSTLDRWQAAYWPPVDSRGRCCLLWKG